jgi:5-formyltetrahydrofolate cyclo-ligase
MLRKRARSLRRSLSASAAAERSRKIADRLAALPVFESARTVALYHPIARRNEVDVLALDALVRSRGGVVAYPCTEAEAGHMTFRAPTGIDAMNDRGSGIVEPEPTAPAVADLDVVVVPALWVDLEGRRIGYGGGYYDRALASLRPHAVAIAVVYHFQLGADLPEMPGDQRVDWVVTDEIAHEVAARGRSTGT